MADLVFVYGTAPDRAAAAAIAEALVEERLAACVNIFEDMNSVYRWRGAVEHGRECAYIAKTRAAKVEAVTRRILALHSDDCPCIVALPLLPGLGNAGFHDWIRQQTPD